MEQEGSTQQDDKEVKYITNVLKNDFNLFETKEEGKKREEVLVSLKTCVKEAVKNIYKSKGKTEEEANLAGGGVFSFGSYRLGIVGPGDDIDVLCIAPATDTRESNGDCERIELFNEMKNQLEKLKSEKEITQILPISDAKVPIIKIIYKDIPIDILVASVSFKSIDEHFNLEDDNVLKNCCEKCILSLNGCRVTNAIFNSLPKEMKIDDFKLTLRAIKLWAKKRGIYSNAMGYPGGVAWAILVAKICQKYPKYRANKLIRKFFEEYGNWDWNNPVQINEIKEDVGFTCPISVWKKDSKEKEKDINHCPFYIITPAFPAQNTNAQTNQILKRVMIEEFQLFNEYSKKINIEDPKNEYTWKGLFQGANLFDGYKYFLQIDILAADKSDFKEWDGYVESRLRKLILLFIEIPQIKLRPFSVGYEIKDSFFSCSKTYFFGINFVDPATLDPKPNKVINLREPIKKFVYELEKNREKYKLKKNEANKGEVNKNDSNKSKLNVRINFKALKDLPIEILKK
jgi:poly(A) polymerase